MDRILACKGPFDQEKRGKAASCPYAHRMSDQRARISSPSFSVVSRYTSPDACPPTHDPSIKSQTSGKRWLDHMLSVLHDNVMQVTVLIPHSDIALELLDRCFLIGNDSMNDIADTYESSE
jgi:hypothetical protein